MSSSEVQNKGLRVKLGSVDPQGMGVICRATRPREWEHSPRMCLSTATNCAIALIDYWSMLTDTVSCLPSISNSSKALCSPE